jgi:mycofactocin radical SAM maturase
VPAKAVRESLARGLSSPICLTWELTYGCNLACVHCLSSSGRRDPRELSTTEAMRLIEEFSAMQIFYINIGGGEPTLRRDFFDLVDYAVYLGVGVKFSTNGTTMNPARAARLAEGDYVDVQVSLDGASAATNDAVRGEGSFAAGCQALGYLAEAGFSRPKLSVVVTRLNIPELGDLVALADSYGAQLRLTRLRPSGRGAASFAELVPTRAQQVELYRFLSTHEEVLTGDSFFHLSALGEPLAGLGQCGAGRVVCLVDPLGDVYACPFTMHPDFLAGSVRSPGGLTEVWRSAALFSELRAVEPSGSCRGCGALSSCGGGCMAAKFFTGLDLAGPDPECVFGHSATPVAFSALPEARRPGAGHSGHHVSIRPVAVRPVTARPVTARPAAARPVAVQLAK